MVQRGRIQRGGIGSVSKPLVCLYFFTTWRAEPFFPLYVPVRPGRPSGTSLWPLGAPNGHEEPPCGPWDLSRSSRVPSGLVQTKILTSLVWEKVPVRKFQSDPGKNPSLEIPV